MSTSTRSRFGMLAYALFAAILLGGAYIAIDQFSTGDLVEFSVWWTGDAKPTTIRHTSDGPQPVTVSPTDITGNGWSTTTTYTPGRQYTLWVTQPYPYHGTTFLKITINGHPTAQADSRFGTKNLICVAG